MGVGAGVLAQGDPVSARVLAEARLTGARGTLCAGPGGSGSAAAGFTSGVPPSAASEGPKRFLRDSVPPAGSPDSRIFLRYPPPQSSSWQQCPCQHTMGALLLRAILLAAAHSRASGDGRPNLALFFVVSTSRPLRPHLTRCH